MRKLKVAVIGVGFWGRNHARIFSELRQTELVAVCDVEKEKAVNIAKKYGVDAYTDSMKLVVNKEVDALSICTWTTTHAKEASVALKADKHLLVEKPIASTVDEAKRIVKLARKKQRILMVGFIERFNPSVQRVREELSKGSIGTVVSATARRVSRWPERIGDVGIVKDTAIHDIDVMRHLFSEDPVSVFANTGNLKHTKYDDYAQIVLTFKNGKTAFIETNWLTPNKVRKLIVTGSEGIISMDYLTQEVKIEKGDFNFID